MKKYRLSTILKVGIPLVILAVLVILGLTVFTKKEVSLAEYVVVKVEGVNSRGCAKASLDEVGLYNALAGKDSTDESQSVYREFVDTVEIILSKDENLSNGDVITVTAEYDREAAKRLGISVEVNKREYKVSGLKNGQRLDLFSGIKIITGGTSPYVYATYLNESDDEYQASLEYSIDKTSGLAIGDEITITCLIDETMAAQAGYFYDTNEIKYTITSADKYVDRPDELDMALITSYTEDNIQRIIDETDDTTYHMSFEVTGDSGYLYRDNNEKAVSFEYYGTTLANNITGYEQKHENYVLVFYKGYIALPRYTVEDDPYDYIEAFFCFMYSDAVLTMDKEFVMTPAETMKPYVCGQSYDATVTAVEELIGRGYDIQELK